jgi:hypothetical protein
MQLSLMVYTLSSWKKLSTKVLCVRADLSISCKTRIIRRETKTGNPSLAEHPKQPTGPFSDTLPLP